MKNKYLALKVKNLRKRKGYSQEELAENSGLSLRTIQRIEKGENEPTGETLKRISNSLNVNPEELVDWSIIKDTGYLKAMNISALAFILFPLLGILIPLIMWISKKDKIKEVREIGSKIINFQISWTIILFLIIIINYLFLANMVETSDSISPYYFIKSQRFNLLFILIMYILNFLIIAFNTYRIHKNKSVYYLPTLSFI